MISPFEPSKFMRYFKLDQWWSNKVNPLLGFAFLGMMQNADPPPAREFLEQLLLFLVACFGIGAFGHLFLDFFDIEEDRRNKKSNGWLMLGYGGGSFVLLVLLAASWLPWWWLPNGDTTRWLIAAEFVFFTAYAVPPLRLKERGIWGVVADSLYAYVMPAVVTWNTFAPGGGEPLALASRALLVIWLLPMGMRHLLHHQYKGLDLDRAAGVRTFVVRHGPIPTLQLIKTRLLPVETAGALLALPVLSWPLPLPLLGLLAFAAWEWRVIRWQWLQPVPPINRWRAIDWLDLFGVRLLSTYLEHLFPALALAVMLVWHPSLWPCAPVYALQYALLPGHPLRLRWYQFSRLVPNRFTTGIS